MEQDEFSLGVRDFLLEELRQMRAAGHNPDLIPVEVAIIQAAVSLVLVPASWGVPVPRETTGAAAPGA